MYIFSFRFIILLHSRLVYFSILWTSGLTPAKAHHCDCDELSDRVVMAEVVAVDADAGLAGAAEAVEGIKINKKTILTSVYFCFQLMGLSTSIYILYFYFCDISQIYFIKNGQATRRVVCPCKKSGNYVWPEDDHGTGEKSRELPW